MLQIVVQKYAPDYRMNLFEIAFMTRDEVNRRFHNDFRIMVDASAGVRAQVRAEESASADLMVSRKERFLPVMICR